ncbi:MAG: radical SAM protein [Candidatus Auribacterota bacterium]|nr:radical SAM protein [Candidatus Auribacterota bacterium]
MDSCAQLLLITCPSRWPRLPALGEACLKAYLEANEIRTDVLDLNNYCYSFVNDELKRLWELPVYPAFSAGLWDHLEKKYRFEFESILSAIIAHPAKTVGLSVWHSSKIFSQKLALYVRQYAPKKRIVAGGPEVTLSSLEKIFSAGNDFFYADYCIAGEGEYNLLNLLTKSLQTNVKYYDFLETDPDSLPAPDYRQIFPKPYRYPNTRPVWMSRGCIRRCAFCVEHALTKRYRQKRPEAVVRELNALHSLHGVNHVIFYDSLINGNIRLFEEFLDRMIDARTAVKWEGQLLIRPDMPARLYGKMKQAGCYNLFIGLESGCDRILSAMRKGFSTNDAQDCFKACSDAQLHFEVSLIAGFPTETQADFESTLDFLKKNARVIPKIAQVNPFMPLAVSPLLKDSGKQVICEFPDLVLTRVQRIVDVCRSNGIAVTPAYVNNLMAQTAGFDTETGSMIIY